MDHAVSTFKDVDSKICHVVLRIIAGSIGLTINATKDRCKGYVMQPSKFDILHEFVVNSNLC